MELKEFPAQNAAQKDKKAFRPQVVIVCTYVMVGISLGMSMGHTAVLLPQLKSVNSTIHVDEDTGSWIASLNAGAGPIGSLLGGVTMDQWGRRKISFVASSISFLGWLLICVSYSASALMVAKTIEGFARSMAATTLTILIDEVADPEFRGSILCIIMTCVSVGIMVIGSLAAFMHWRIASGVAAVVTLASVFAFFFVTESPPWLVRKNRLEEATRALTWLWGPGRETQAQEDLEFLKNRHSSKEEGRRNLQEFLKTCKGFFTPRILKPFFILHVFSTIQVFCGFSIFTFYAVDILLKMKEAGESEIMDENLSAVVIFFVRIVGNIATALLIIRIGRRSIAIISGVGCTLSGLGLGILLIMQSAKISLFGSAQIDSWLVFTLTIAFAFAHSFGFLSLPVLMLGETQAAHVRGFVCGYIYTINDLVLGGTLKFYPTLTRSIQIHGMFILFGVSCLICTIFVYLFLPETQGKTLEQIEDYFRQPNVMWITRKKVSRCNTQ